MKKELAKQKMDQVLVLLAQLDECDISLVKNFTEKELAEWHNDLSKARNSIKKGWISAKEYTQRKVG